MDTLTDATPTSPVSRVEQRASTRRRRAAAQKRAAELHRPVSPRTRPLAPGRRRSRAAAARGVDDYYGIVDEGAYSGIACWRSRDGWLRDLHSDLHGVLSTAARRNPGNRGPVSVQACFAVAAGVAASADGRTGRNAMPGEAALIAGAEQLAEDLDLDEVADRQKLARRLAVATGYAETTVEKAVTVLLELGWLVRLRVGKNWLSRAEKVAIWGTGSKARQQRAVYACTVPRDLSLRAGVTPSLCRCADVPVDNSPAGATETAQPDSGCALPTARRASGQTSVIENKSSRSKEASRNDPSGRATTNTASSKRTHQTHRIDPRTLSVAITLRRRLPWLRNVPTQRITSSVHRFAVAGWTAGDIKEALDQLLAQRRWQVPDDRTPAELAATRRVDEHRRAEDQGRSHTAEPDESTTRPLRRPWAYLAYLLRAIEPTDRVLEREYERAIADAQREYARQLISGPACPHGQPGGAILSPARSLPACPDCRRSAS